MDADRHQLAKALFLEACELPSAQWPGFLDSRCGGDATLRAQVQGMLAADGEDGFLQTPATAPANLDHIAGERGFRLVRRLGAGGMGEVWLAERADGDFQQRVAIKLMHASAALSQEAQRRFRAERQILAGLSHPNIARLLDGGTLADGAPYLVMEYVAGQPLDAWCRDRALDLRARVRLFLKVCDAVQAAHAALVVHRDLKPSNILVGPDGEPKLLDFGIAKVLDRAQFAQSLVQTRTGMAPMTLAYASPEQVRGNPVGTSSDAYSLAVVLYELLTGCLPYRVALTDPLGVARAVCEDTPEAPSRTTAGAEGADTATLRRARGELRGDLDAILLKALRKEARDRYRSVEHFAADLQRWLDGLPVLARRGSRAYAARKFVARHRWAVSALLLVLALVFGFALDRQRQLLVVQQQRDRAEQALGLLREVLGSADPAIARGQELSARQILASATQKLAADATIDAGVRFDLLLALTDIEQVLGLAGQAQAHVETLAPLAARLPPPASERLELVSLQGLNARGETVEADALGARLAARIAAGASALTPVEQAKALIARANTLNLLSRGAQAEPLLRDALRLLPADGGAEPRLRASADSQLGQVLQNLGRLPEAEVHLREALAISLRHAFDPYRVSRDQNNLAGVLAMQGRFGEALELHEDGIARFEQAVGRNHPEYAVRLNNLGSTEYGAGRLDAALDHLRSALERARESYGADHHIYAMTLANLGGVETALGDFASAQAHIDTARTILLGRFGPANLLSIRALRAAGVLALERADAGAARAAFQACLDGAASAGLEANPGVTRCRLGLAELAMQDGQLETAGQLLDIVEGNHSALDPRHFERGIGALLRAAWLLQRGERAGALEKLAAIPLEALVEPWQADYRALLQAAAQARCAQASAPRAALALRHPQGNPRWQAWCASP